MTLGQKCCQLTFSQTNDMFSFVCVIGFIPYHTDISKKNAPYHVHLKCLLPDFNLGDGGYGCGVTDEKAGKWVTKVQENL